MTPCWWPGGAEDRSPGQHGLLLSRLPLESLRREDAILGVVPSLPPSLLVSVTSTGTVELPQCSARRPVLGPPMMLMKIRPNS